MPKILVTGCQRSGTRFYGKFLAEQHKCPYIDEADYATRDYDKLLTLIRDKESWVIHGPAIKHHVVPLLRTYPDAKVIWMYRDVRETRESMARIGWATHAHKELAVIVPLIREYENEILRGESLDDYYEANDEGIFGTIAVLTVALGVFYAARGLVEMKNMREIENLSGFRKSTTI
jgi:hypothetical protein